MTSRNLDYYQQRAEEELEAAERAGDPAIARIHREMAQRYRAMPGRDVDGMNGMGTGQRVGGTNGGPGLLSA